MRLGTKNFIMAGFLTAGVVLFFGTMAVAQKQVPDFLLPDVNATSSTHNQSVSPRDYLQQVSGWYFGHAT